VYRQFSDYANLGYAATLGVVIFGITLVATALQLVPAWSSRGAGRSGRAARAAAATAPEAKP
jgi:ABC-type spermidine/putrescine transport system permease subunit I